MSCILTGLFLLLVVLLRAIFRLSLSHVMVIFSFMFLVKGEVVERSGLVETGHGRKKKIAGVYICIV